MKFARNSGLRQAGYTLSIKLDTATVIPAGTRATPDGDVVFATLQDLTIPAGQLSGDVAAECTQAGEIGNGFVPGQIKQAVDVFPYYCHPYSSYERGSNECQNKMIRRKFPKGTDFGKVSAAEIEAAEAWMNNYPREILGWKTAEICFRECIAALV